MNLRLCIAIPVVVAFAACSGAPAGGGAAGQTLPQARAAIRAQASIAPYYIGSVTFDSKHAEPMAMSLDVNGSDVAGSWGAMNRDVADVGSVKGTIDGDTLHASLSSLIRYKFQPLFCPMDVTGTISGDDLNGTIHTAAGCSASESGTFTLISSKAPRMFARDAAGSLDISGSEHSVTAKITQRSAALYGPFTVTESQHGTSYSGRLYAFVRGLRIYFDLIPSDDKRCPLTGEGYDTGSSSSGSLRTVECPGQPEIGTYKFTTL